MLDKIDISLKKKKLIVYVALAVVTLAVYWQVNQFDFVNLDDNVYVTGNIHVQSGITMEGVRWAFSTTYAQYWHPVTWLSLMFDYQIFGLNAGGYHVINLILHLLSTLLLFWLFYRTTGEIWKSAFVAAVFALHPLRVESIAWIAKRRDVLCIFFSMLTLCLYVYYTEKPIIRRYLLVIFPFALALMCKPMVVTLPLIMILLDYWPLGRFESKKVNLILWQLREKMPFFILSAVFSIITIYARYYGENPFENYFPWSSRLANASVSFMTYLEKTFWPHDLTVLLIFPAQIPAWQIIGSALLIIIISVAVIIAVKRLPYFFVGWLWYSITLLPVLGIIQFGHLAMSDHHTYLPSIGIAIMLAWGIPLLFSSENVRKKILFPVAIVILFALSVLTFRQCGYWKDSIELFSHALQVTKNNYMAHDNLAAALIEKGKTKEAFYHCNQSISIAPYFEISYNNRGLIYAKRGQYQLAFEDYNKAIILKPDYAVTYYNRGIAYGEKGQYQLAIEDYNKAILLKPDYADAYYKRGIIYGDLGQNRLSIEDFSKAILINPAYIASLNNRGSAYAKLGQYKRAIEYYNEAIRFQPNNALFYNNRGAAYLTHGDSDLGCRDAHKACELGDCTTFKIAKSKGDCPILNNN